MDRRKMQDVQIMCVVRRCPSALSGLARNKQKYRPGISELFLFAPQSGDYEFLG